MNTNNRLALALVLALIFFGSFAGRANAQTAPLIILTPDGVTGEVEFHVNTGTNDARVTETCIYRVDANSPDASVPIACALVSTGRPPATPGESTPNGEGVFLSIPVVVSILPEDQHFGAKNVADVEGQSVLSAMSTNTAVLPLAVVAPLFVVLGSGS